MNTHLINLLHHFMINWAFFNSFLFSLVESQGRVVKTKGFQQTLECESCQAACQKENGVWPRFDALDAPADRQRLVQVR